MKLAFVAFLSATCLLIFMHFAGVGGLLQPRDKHWVWSSSLAGLAAGLGGFVVAALFVRSDSPVRSALLASAAMLVTQIGIDVHLRSTSDFYHGTMPPMPVALRAFAACVGLVTAALLSRRASSGSYHGPPD